MPVDDTNSPQVEFSLTETRKLIDDLFTPRPWIYWLDFLLTYTAGWFCILQVYGGSIFAPHKGWRGDFQQVIYFVASCLLVYRAVLFIHEIVHQRTAGRLAIFRLVWNVLCGIPLLVPSFVYYTHIDHHRRHHFGTEKDGEYLPLAHRPAWHTILYLLWSFVIPLLAIVRFTVLTPMAWCIPGFRDFVHKRASSLVIDPSYIRPLPTKQTMRIIYVQECACFAWCVALAAYVVFAFDRIQIALLAHIYLMAVCIIMLNSVRTLGSHRWQNDGGEMSFVDQLLDSVNYPGFALVSELWGPVGLRFHALHHLFPSLPYHALPEAHRRLTKSLPEDSPYRLTHESSLTAAIADLLRRSRRNKRRAGQRAVETG